MLNWVKAADCKSVTLETLGVRVPPLPPKLKNMDDLLRKGTYGQIVTYDEENDRPMIIFCQIIEVNKNDRTLLVKANDVDLLVKDVPFDEFKIS